MTRTHTHSDPCEWYCSYGHLRHLINPIALTAHGASAASSLLLAKPNTLPVGGEAHNKESPLPSSFPNMDQSRVLILGCGNSTMGADMLRDGWTGGIVGIDFSETVIAQMKEKYVVSQNHAAGADGKKQLDFVCADVTKPLDLWPDASFDLILCKGALDAVLCSPGSRASALAMVSECTRLLAPGHGIFFLVTAGNPDSRLEYLEYQNELAHYWRGVSVHPLKDELLRSAAAASNVHGAAVADANK